MSSAALVGTDGSVDWCCLPRFDSPSVFAAILDQDIGGRFRIRPSGAYTGVQQAYMQDTNVLETTFTTATGVVTLTDFMPIHDSDMDGRPDTNPEEPPELHRIVTCTAGSVEMRCDYEPRHDYARSMPEFRALRSNGNGAAVEAHGGRQSLMLLASVPLSVHSGGVSGEITLSQGESATFVMAYGRGRSGNLERYRSQEKLQQTQRYWQELVAGMNYEGMWREPVVRSFLLLHLMMYRGTGAIVAAPTTSLPETLGGIAKLGLPLLVAARHQLHRRHPLSLGRRVRSGPLHPMAAGAMPAQQAQDTHCLRDHPDILAQGAGAGPPARVRGLAARAHRQRRGGAPADGRVRRGHIVDSFPAGAA